MRAERKEEDIPINPFTAGEAAGRRGCAWYLYWWCRVCSACGVWCPRGAVQATLLCKLPIPSLLAVCHSVAVTAVSLHRACLTLNQRFCRAVVPSCTALLYCL